MVGERSPSEGGGGPPGGSGEGPAAARGAWWGRVWWIGAAAALSLAVTWGVGSGRILLGSAEGRWVYPFLKPPSWSTWLGALTAIGLALGLLRFTLRILHTNEALALFLWLAGGLAVQTAARLDAPAPLGTIVVSDRANSFYGPALRNGPVDFLSRHEEIARDLPLHARTNMPGKVIFYHFLRIFSGSPGALGILVVGFSNLGGLLLYLGVRDLLDDRRAALFAMALYVVVPGKLVFLPILNTVSPVFALLAFRLLVRFLRAGRPVHALLLGLSAYLLLFFEPLPLAMGLAFLALLAGAVMTGGLAPRRAALGAAGAAGAFAGAHLTMLAVFDYDILRNFLHLLAEAHDFNVRAGRPYGLWAARNLLDFAFCAGIAPIALFAPAILDLFRRGGGAPRREPPGHPTILALALPATLVALDLAGINRGEVVRLWIFLACFFQTVPAYLCARMEGSWPFAVIMTATILQAATAAGAVGFVLP